MNFAKLSRRNRILLIVGVVVAISVAGWWLYNRTVNPNGSGLAASGTVEAVEVQIASEVSGKVAEIMVEEGDSFQAGDPLFRLDDELLKSQRAQTAAALQAAKDNLTASQVAVDTAEVALKVAETNAEAAKASAEAELLPAQQALQNLYDNADVTKTAAEQALAVATRTAREAQYQYDNFTVPSDQAGMTTAKALEVMKARLDVARKNFEPYKYEDSGNATRDDLKDALDEAQAAYDAAVRRLELETALNQANARQQKAQLDVDALQNGPKNEDVAAMEARITAIQTAPKQAEAAVEQARTGIDSAKAKLAQAQSAVAQAQAALDSIDVQLKKLVVHAPSSGVLLARGIEPGEVVAAGASVMTIGLLDNLNITVYLPEDRYGAIKLGQKANVTVDSFPGRVFTATIINISDKAEYTPRNVQTVEGRKSTVYAVKLSIANQDLALKIGMPADVSFE
jgi:multidrug resistance efflux pump